MLDLQEGASVPSTVDRVEIPLDRGTVIPATDSLSDLATPQSDEELTRSVADPAMHHTSDISIGHAINELADKLAALCFEHLEEDLSSGDGDNVIGNLDREAFEEEFRVRDFKVIRR